MCQRSPQPEGRGRCNIPSFLKAYWPTTTDPQYSAFCLNPRPSCRKDGHKLFILRFENKDNLINIKHFIILFLIKKKKIYSKLHFNLQSNLNVKQKLQLKSDIFIFSISLYLSAVLWCLVKAEQQSDLRSLGAPCWLHVEALTHFRHRRQQELFQDGGHVLPRARRHFN